MSRLFDWSHNTIPKFVWIFCVCRVSEGPPHLVTGSGQYWGLRVGGMRGAATRSPSAFGGRLRGPSHVHCGVPYLPGTRVHVSSDFVKLGILQLLCFGTFEVTCWDRAPVEGHVFVYLLTLSVWRFCCLFSVGFQIFFIPVWTDEKWNVIKPCFHVLLWLFFFCFTHCRY